MADNPVQKHQPREGELLQNPELSGNFINQATFQILIERNKPEEIKELMRAELDFNREKLEIIREHEEKHPDFKECRRDKVFRRLQYFFLMCCVPGLFF